MTSATTSSLPGATLADRLDAQAHALLARASGGLSPASALLAWFGTGLAPGQLARQADGAGAVGRHASPGAESVHARAPASRTGP